MKISEVVQRAKVSQVRPGQTAEIDHGDGTKTVVDLRKNPGALQKDPNTGKVRLNKTPQSASASRNRTNVNPGDEVEMDDES